MKLCHLPVSGIQTPDSSLWPSPLCKQMIEARRCPGWVSPDGWEMTQRDVCLICQARNQAWFYGAAMNAARIKGRGKSDGGIQSHI